MLIRIRQIWLHIDIFIITGDCFSTGLLWTDSKLIWRIKYSEFSSKQSG